MGSFDVTCAFSRAGIALGEEVLLVVTHQNNWDTYKLMSDCHQYKFSNQQLKPQLESPFQFIGVGLYDDYGTIENFHHEVKENALFSLLFPSVACCIMQNLVSYVTFCH